MRRESHDAAGGHGPAHLEGLTKMCWLQLPSIKAKEEKKKGTTRTWIWRERQDEWSSRRAYTELLALTEACNPCRNIQLHTGGAEARGACAPKVRLPCCTRGEPGEVLRTHRCTELPSLRAPCAPCALRK